MCFFVTVSTIAETADQLRLDETFLPTSSTAIPIKIRKHFKQNWWQCSPNITNTNFQTNITLSTARKNCRILKTKIIFLQ